MPKAMPSRLSELKPALRWLRASQEIVATTGIRPPGRISIKGGRLGVRICPLDPRRGGSRGRRAAGGLHPMPSVDHPNPFPQIVDPARWGATATDKRRQARLSGSRTSDAGYITMI